MIKSITVTNYLNESLTLELANPWKTGIYIQKIEGLGPPKATINSTTVSSGDGSVYNSARTESRNIVITLGFLGVSSVEEERQLTYKFFPLKKPVTILVETDNRLCKATGYVESNEPDIFNSQETSQVSIICPDPYFYSADNHGINTVKFSGIEPNFEFPFSNESLEEPKLEFGIVKIRQEENVYYDGDAETGITMVLHALGEVRQITIYNTTTRERMHIDTDKLSQIMGSGIKESDVITISTVKGDKYIKILRDGKETNILNALDRDTDWFQLSKGDNPFAYTCDYGTENLEFRIEYKTLYEGV